MRWCFSGGHISPPPSPQRKLINPSTSSLNEITAGSSSSSNEIVSSNEDHRQLKFAFQILSSTASYRMKLIFVKFSCRRAEKSDSHTTRTSNRPSLAPKPKFDNRNNSTSLNDKKESLQGLQKSNSMDGDSNSVDSVTRRLQKIGLLNISQNLLFKNN